MRYAILIWAGLWRKPTRTTLTLLSVIIAFVLFGLLQGINHGIGKVVENMNIDRLYVTSRISLSDAKGLPLAHWARLQQVPGVRAVTHWTYFAGFYQDARHPISAFATDVDALIALYPELVVSRDQVEAMRRTRAGALIGKPLADRYGWKIGDTVPIGSTIWTKKGGRTDWQFEIVGIYESAKISLVPPTNVYINYGYFDEARAAGNGTVHLYIAGITDPRQATPIAAQIDALFANSTAETKTESEQAFAQSQLRQVADIDLIVNAIVAAVLFTLLFLTANTMMQSVGERIPELAVLKTLGYSDGKVVGLVLVESLLLCLFASLTGLGLARLLFVPLGSVLGVPTMPVDVVLLGMATAVLLALVSGMPPAWRAKRLQIVDALADR